MNDEAGPDNRVLVLGLLGLGLGAGYLYWRDQQAKEAASLAAARYQATYGGTRSTALENIAKAVCQGAGLKVGIPPNLSSGVCRLLSPSIAGGVTGAARGTLTVGKNVGREVKNIASVPVNIVKSTFRAIKHLF